AFQIVDDVKRILAVTCHDNAGDYLTFTVQLRDSASLIRRQLDPRHVADQHRCALFRLDHEILDVGYAAQVAPSAHHVFGLGHFDHPAAHVAVTGTDYRGNLA